MSKEHKDIFSGDLFPAERPPGGEEPPLPEEFFSEEPMPPDLEESPLGEPPPDNDKGWGQEEIPSKKEYYIFNQRIDRLDFDRLLLCPECGAKSDSKKPDLDSKWGEMRFRCSSNRNHRWAFVPDEGPSSRGGIVKDLNERLEFPKQ